MALDLEIGTAWTGTRRVQLDLEDLEGATRRRERPPLWARVVKPWARVRTPLGSAQVAPAGVPRDLGPWPAVVAAAVVVVALVVVGYAIGKD